MNLTIRADDVALPDGLREALCALVAEGLRAMGAPPDAGVAVALRGPARAGARRHRAEAVVHAGGGALRAEGVAEALAPALTAMQRAGA